MLERRTTDDEAPRGRLIWRLARLAAFVLALGAGGLALLVHDARGDARRAFYSLGENLIAFYGEDEGGAAPRALVLNGARLHLVTGTTDRGVAEVLDFYERRCQGRDGRLAETAAGGGAANAGAASGGAAGGGAAGGGATGGGAANGGATGGGATGGGATGGGAAPASSARSRLLDATMRHEGGGKGFVACLDLGPDPISLADLGGRAREVARTGDLGRLGRFRYLYAERGPARTRFVAVWTDGQFNLLRLFPPDGDAPGADPPTLPRPPDAVRRLSAHEEGFPQRQYVYESARTPAELDAHYRLVLPRRGWRLLDAGPPAPGSPPGARVIVAERGAAEMAVLVLAPDDEGGAFASVLVAR